MGAHLRAEMDEVMAELADDLKKEISKREIQKTENDIKHKQNDIDTIKNIENNLGTTGFTTAAQDKALMKQITAIMRDLANDPKLDPPTVTKRGLAKKGCTDRTIDEEMKLKKFIWKSVTASQLISDILEKSWTLLWRNSKKMLN